MTTFILELTIKALLKRRTLFWPSESDQPVEFFQSGNTFSIREDWKKESGHVTIRRLGQLPDTPEWNGLLDDLSYCGYIESYTKPSGSPSVTDLIVVCKTVGRLTGIKTQIVET